MKKATKFESVIFDEEFTVLFTISKKTEEPPSQKVLCFIGLVLLPHQYHLQMPISFIYIM